ncbi:hypothetical protein [Burkholderia gladioli]|uniref:hypothetical protein n=2 Tax=Burkholderia TaxID=32008 RepID=UPI00164156F2|nr:hypothetical protein [Burkholderia gladioli]
MTNLTPTPGWDSVPLLEAATKAMGGAGGAMNSQAQALLNRTEALNPANQIDNGGILGDISAWVLGVSLAFTQRGTGAVLRTIFAKLRDMPISVRDFGAVCNGVADDTAAIQAALNFAGPGGRVIIPHDAKCFVGGNLIVPPGVMIEGNYFTPDSLQSMSDGPILIDGMGSAISLSSSATITMKGGSALMGLLLKRAGLVVPSANASAFAGTAVTIGGPGAYVGYSMILGFNQAIHSDGFERGKFERIFGDNINGIEVTNAFDSPDFDKIRFWPYVTYSPSASASAHVRAGNGFYIHDNVDEPNLSGCFAFGYANGYYFKNVSTVTATHCKADGISKSVGSAGWRFEGNINGFVGFGNSSWSNEDGIIVNVNSTQFVELSGFMCNSNATQIAHVGGHVRVRLCQFYTADTLASYGASAGVLDVDQNLIANVTNMIAAAALTHNVRIGNGNINLTSANGTAMASTNTRIPEIASADPLPLPPTGDCFKVTGTVSFGNLQGGHPGRRVTLQFASALTVYTSTANANSMRLQGDANFATSANSTVEFRHNGQFWVAVGQVA